MSAGTFSLHPARPRGFSFDALTAVPQAVKASNGVFVGGNAHNPGATPVVLEIFAGLAADVLLGTTPPAWHFTLPAGWSGVVDPPRIVSCPSGISIAAVTTIGGDTAPAAPITGWVSYF